MNVHCMELHLNRVPLQYIDRSGSSNSHFSFSPQNLCFPKRVTGQVPFVVLLFRLFLWCCVYTQELPFSSCARQKARSSILIQRSLCSYFMSDLSRCAVTLTDITQSHCFVFHGGGILEVTDRMSRPLRRQNRDRGVLPL
jgi:hypothetical protein